MTVFQLHFIHHHRSLKHFNCLFILKIVVWQQLHHLMKLFLRHRIDCPYFHLPHRLKQHLRSPLGHPLFGFLHHLLAHHLGHHPNLIHHLLRHQARFHHLILPHSCHHLQLVALLLDHHLRRLQHFLNFHHLMEIQPLNQHYPFK